MMNWEPPEDWSPEGAVVHALVAQSEGEPYNEDEFVLACAVIATANLMHSGLDEERALDVVTELIERGGIRATYNVDDGLSIAFGAVEDVDS